MIISITYHPPPSPRAVLVGTKINFLPESQGALSNSLPAYLFLVSQVGSIPLRHFPNWICCLVRFGFSYLSPHPPKYLSHSVEAPGFFFFLFFAWIRRGLGGGLFGSDAKSSIYCSKVFSSQRLCFHYRICEFWSSLVVGIHLSHGGLVPSAV